MWGTVAIATLALLRPGLAPALAERVGVAASRRQYNPIEQDAALFEAVLRQLIAGSRSGALRVDPRPLRPNPEVLTLTKVYEVVPDRLSAQAHQTLLADTSRTIAGRRAILHREGIPIADALIATGCPGALSVPTAEIERAWRERCPRTPQRTVIIALPRLGALPRKGETATTYPGREVYSIRVIEHSESPQGADQVTFDLIFERTSARKWVLLERRNLLFVE